MIFLFWLAITSLTAHSLYTLYNINKKLDKLNDTLFEKTFMIQQSIDRLEMEIITRKTKEKESVHPMIALPASTKAEKIAKQSQKMRARWAAWTPEKRAEIRLNMKKARIKRAAKEKQPQPEDQGNQLQVTS